MSGSGEANHGFRPSRGPALEPGLRAILSRARGARLQLSVCLPGVGDSLGLDIAGGSAAGDLLPVSPGEYPLDGEHLGGLQPRFNAWAEGGRQSRPARLGVLNTSR